MIRRRLCTGLRAAPRVMLIPALLTLSAVLVAAALTGCKAPAGTDKRVAFLLSTLQEERYQKDRAYFEAKAKELGLDVIALAADNDNARQLAQIEDSLARGAKVIVVQPTDSKAAASYVKLAHERGAKVIAYDRVIASRDLDFYVSHDSYRVGVLQAEAALAATGSRGKYVLLSGQAGHSVANEITRGYLETLRPHIERGAVELVAQQNHSAWAPEQALRTVEDAISRVGHIDAILANNSGMARGAVQAVGAAGLTGVFIAGADADAANVNFVCGSQQSVEVLKDIKPLAETAAEVAAKLMAGTPIETGSTVELEGRAVPTAAVRVELVTPDTVKALIVDSGFLPASSIPACAGRLAGR